MSTIVCVSSIDNFKNLDHDLIICGNIISEKLSKSIDRINKINKSKNEITCLLSREEALLFIILRNIYEHQNDLITEIDYSSKGILYFSENLDLFVGKNVEITLDIFLLFRKLIEAWTTCCELDLNFDFFDLDSFNDPTLDNITKNLIRSNKEIEREIVFAYKFNRIMDTYISLFVNYIEKTKTEISLKSGNISVLVITDPMTCHNTIFCEENCDVKEQKLLCFYNSIKDENRDFSGYDFDIIVTYENGKNQDNVYSIERNKILMIENGNIYSE